MKAMKKFVGIALAATLLIGGLAACSGNDGDDNTTTTTSTTTTTTTTTEKGDEPETDAPETDAPETEVPDTDETTTTTTEAPDDTDDDSDDGANTGGITGAINVYSRDEASGTREAFSSIVGIDEDAGELLDTAAITQGNGDQAAKVGADKQAIGYVALTTDFEGNNIRAVKYEGVEPNEETVNSGEYSLYRPFSYVTRAEDDFASDEEKELTAAFIAFLTESREGLEAVQSEGGIVDLTDAKAWDEIKADYPVVDQDNSAITLKTAGSTSVQKTLDAAIMAFQPLAGNVNIVTDQTGSGDGFKRVMGGDKDGPNASHIGFASREFNEKEAGHEDAMAYGAYCKDAVVIVVEMNNPIENLTQQQVHDIYTGVITDWSDVN